MVICSLGQSRPDFDGKCVVALGNFDGVHIAHTALLERTVKEAKAYGFIPAVFTFNKHTKAVIGKENPLLITVADEKLELFESFGIERVFIADFESIRNYSPERFVNEILIDRLHTAIAVCGFNFRFGINKSGTAQELERLMCKKAIIIPPIMDNDSPVSSTRIRAAVENGDIENANEMLGRPFFIYFPVVHGKELGRTIGVPTINQNFPPMHIIPSHGVYACRVTVDNTEYNGVANIGVRPTVENCGQVNCETHIIGFSGMLYGKRIKVSFYKKIRSEMRFESVDALKNQIFIDIDSVNKYFGCVK